MRSRRTPFDAPRLLVLDCAYICCLLTMAGWRARHRLSMVTPEPRCVYGRMRALARTRLGKLRGMNAAA